MLSVMTTVTRRHKMPNRAIMSVGMISHDDGKPLPSVATPAVPTPIQSSESSKQQPRDVTQDCRKSTPAQNTENTNYDARRNMT